MNSAKSTYRCTLDGKDFFSREALIAHEVKEHGRAPHPLELRVRLDAGEHVEFVGCPLIRVLGQGNNGIVFKATDRADLSRLVAIKMMLRESATTLDEARFRGEMAQMIALPHKNIVAIYEANPAHDPPYIIMEYCELGSVQQRVGPNGLELQDAVTMMTDALAGLCHMHASNRVHRDIKPQNLFLAGRPERPTTKIADLGFTKYVLEERGTRTGPHFESLPFSPPEALVDFKGLTPAGDVWSLGATFYYMLTARPARDLPEGMDLETARLKVPDVDAIPIRQRRPEVPPGLACVIDRSLARDTTMRYSSALKMQQEFTAALTC